MMLLLILLPLAAPFTTPLPSFSLHRLHRLNSLALSANRIAGSSSSTEPAYAYVETPTHVTLTLVDKLETSKGVELEKLLPNSLSFDKNGTCLTPSTVDPFLMSVGAVEDMTSTRLRNFEILLNANGGVKLGLPGVEDLVGVFRGRVVWDTLFWSFDNGVLSLEWEKYDVFSEWERSNKDKEGFKSYVQSGGGQQQNDEEEDELQSLVNGMEGDVLYLDSEYWTAPFVLQPVDIKERPGEDDGMIDVDDYVDRLMGGKKPEESGVDKSLYDLGLGDKEVEEGRRDGIIEDVIEDL